MKFTRYLAKGSLDLANLRVAMHNAPCRHCGCVEAVVAHGYLRGLAQTGHAIVTRGLRFFAPTATPM